MPEERYYAAGSPSVLKGAPISQKISSSSSSSSKAMENQLLSSSAASSSLNLVQQPSREVQQKPFLKQPKVKLIRGKEFSDWQESENVWPLLATASLICPNNTDIDCSAEVALEGNTTVELSNNWANFSNLYVNHFGEGFRLELTLTSAGLNSTEVSVTSAPFDVLEYSLTVTMYNSKPSLTTPNKEHFRLPVQLFLWDAITNMPADSDILNITTWRYIFRLQDNGSPVDVLSGDTTGNFPAGKNRTQHLNLNLTNIGYRYQLNVTVDSPLFKTSISNVSLPFDALRELREKDKKSSKICLTFNGTLSDLDDSEDEFYTTLLNNFGRRYYNVHWQMPVIQDKDSIAVSITLVGRVKELVETKNSLWVDAKNNYELPFGGVVFALQPIMTVEGSAFYGTDPPPNTDFLLYGLSLSTIFTITLMSFLCASFVIAVLLWRIREKRVMESYNRRMRSRKRTNGHVNTAFDSNESVQTRNEVYLIALNERAKERVRTSETEPLRRCSSGGIPRNYRRMHRSKLGSDDEETWGALGDTPIDDDMVFVDTERHDQVYRDVFFSPNKPRQATINSSSTSFQDDYLMRDVPGPSGSNSHRSSHRYGRRKCSVTASTPSGSLTSLPNSRAGSRMWANSMSDNTYSLVRPPVGWSSHDDKRMCNGKNVSPMTNAIC